MELKPGDLCKHKGQLYRVVKTDNGSGMYLLQKHSKRRLYTGPMKVVTIDEIDPAESEAGSNGV